MTDAARRTGTTQVYTWEPSNQAIAARYGVRPEDVVRFDTNTSPAEPAGLAGAPKVGDKAAWAKAIAQGQATAVA